MRNKLRYKDEEKKAAEKLFNLLKAQTKDIRYLRKAKERLEFRIATEAYTLEAERELIKKKNNIEEELKEAMKSYKLKKKIEYIDKDLEELNKKIAELDTQIKESSKKIDSLYRKLYNKVKEKPAKKQVVNNEISLADVAIIKDKKSSNNQNNNNEQK